ncbi:COPII coat assembly protein-like protein [Emericellopsis cladophorae]|uniref:Protein transport protein sec16 n=1 Tax=Emericellopsis cladophorae TaxID=2686198 RepID=A0A9P9Y7Q3_9HYPO|nr:COPII coat assembly protein-like protein [Emericellopsis cladophorae]KAI6785067.1 COPII coat assembly protein-like protein [Emericellopsis cladophorae]
MAAETLPNSSWHPALMPDHESPTKLSPNLEPQPSPGASPDSLHNGTPLEQEPEPFHLDEHSERTGISNSDNVRTDPLPAHIGDQGGAWLTMEQSVRRAPSKHASSMSFARTVSHEVSFADGDEDEADWTPPRTDTDPFKFMAPSDRSNTFPVPAPIVPNGAVEQPLPANQAMEAFGESEDQDWALGDGGEDLSPSQDGQDQQRLPSGAEPSESRHGPTRSMGGDAQPNEDDAAETRFEEGMPLLPGSDSHPAESTTTHKKQGPDLFAEDEPNDDDFFGQIGNSAPSDEPSIEPLERKSTSQVTGDLSTEPLPRQNTFGTLQEDDEPPSDTAKDPTAPAPTRGGHRRTKTQDLKANWEAALMDDEDDDLLLDDDEEENKDLNTAGFLGSDDEGLLEDEGGYPTPAAQQPAPRQTSSSNPYAPQSYRQPATVPAHSSQQSATGSYFNPPAPANAYPGGPQYGRPPLPGSDQPKAQSFADKSKGGYASPYDLPTDIIASVPKPRKRPSTQQMYAPSAPAQQGPPPGPPSRVTERSHLCSSNLVHLKVHRRVLLSEPIRRIAVWFRPHPTTIWQRFSILTLTWAGPSNRHGSSTWQHAIFPCSPASASTIELYHSPNTAASRDATSITMTMVAPTDGREQDPLQRWKGVPLFTWGAGGAVVTSFPKSIPRYSMGSSTPTVTRTPGEVKMQNIRDIDTLPERLINFPGPLKGKSKKKETIAWLGSGIEIIEKELPDLSFHSALSTEVKRSFERLLLWKILRVFIENDGVLEGKPNVDKAVRDILSPEANGSEDAHAGASVTAMQADAVDAGSMEAIRASLFKGDRESAVWSAVDKRLWGHAMLIANTVSPDLYKQVTQEFVRKEVNYQGHNNESMAALYKILSGNYEDCVDELVPSHARAGFQLLSTTGAASGPAKDAMDGLDKWRETLALVLTNRSQGDVQGLKALGSLLASYGRAEAAHVCFIFSKSASICGGLDDPTADFVLLGSDHKQQSSRFGKETEALQLSEVFEYGLSLAGAVGGLPHLAGYKFQHALTLAEHGQRDKALQYCESIATAISSQTKRSPYFNPYVAACVDDLIARLKQVPKGESGSWISKPSMGKVSDSMWNKFNKFVAGDDEQQGAPGADGSPFSHIGGGTPTISRSPSTNNFETYGAPAPAYGTVASPPATAVPSKYAPMSASPYQPSSQYAPAPAGAPQETSYPAHGHSSYAPTSGYQPSEPSGEMPASPSYEGYQPHVQPQSPNVPGISGAHQGRAEPQGAYNPPDYGYAPPQDLSATKQEDNHVNEPRSGGYEPPAQQSYGYEPPSYQPDFTADDDEDTKPKRGTMDDEDDAPRPSSQQSKADKDRENEEMFRKAAEEDAKRAEAEKANKKGWGLSGWFGGKKPASPSPGESSKKPVRANLGEASSFVYDPDLKRWVNKKPGAENTPAKTATPPPPRAGPPGARSVSGTPPPPMSTPPPMRSASGGPPPRSIPSSNTLPNLKAPASNDNMSMPPPSAPMARSVSSQSAGAPPSAPPSRPGTSMSNASSIDDLIGAAAPRKPGQKKARKSGRYVDVMAK